MLLPTPEPSHYCCLFVAGWGMVMEETKKKISEEMEVHKGLKCLKKEFEWRILMTNSTRIEFGRAEESKCLETMPTLCQE